MTQDVSLRQCDCCGQMKPGVAQLIMFGIETWACEKCRAERDHFINQGRLFAERILDRSAARQREPHEDNPTCEDTDND